MGRKPEAWKLRPHGDVLYVRFRWQGRRIERTTGERDQGRARERAAQIYAEVVSGRSFPAPEGLQSLTAALADYLVQYAKEHKPGTVKTVRDYARAHWTPFFRSADRFTTPAIDDYRRARLTAATRVTVRKELSGLRLFAEWWKAHGGPDVAVPSLPKKGFEGTRHANARKEMATIIEPVTFTLILSKMRRRSRPSRNCPDGFPEIAWWLVYWETGLRPSTISALTTKHYKKGAAELLITRDIDKARHERRIPLSDVARAALDDVVPQIGKLFPPYSKDTTRGAFTRACELAGVEGVSTYDLRHSRLTLWANAGGPLPGVQWLAGHVHLSTTARYVRPQESAARKVLELATEKKE